LTRSKEDKPDVLTYSVALAAEKLGLSTNSVYSMIRQKTMVAVRFGRRILIPKNEINRLLGIQETNQKVGQPSLPGRGQGSPASAAELHSNGITITPQAQPMVQQFTQVNQLIVIDVSPRLASIMENLERKEGTRVLRQEIEQIPKRLLEDTRKQQGKK
jgi:excisionase family DNA binding protein